MHFVLSNACVQVREKENENKCAGCVHAFVGKRRRREGDGNDGRNNYELTTLAVKRGAEKSEHVRHLNCFVR